MKTKKTARGGNVFVKEGLCDPDDPATQLVLWFFSMDQSLIDDLYQASLNSEDASITENLAPLSCVIFDILQAAEVRRSDRIPAGNRKHHPAQTLIHPLGFFN